MTATAQTNPDPGDVQAAIDRYRDLAKYLITIFAAIGGLLVAGTQLSALGKLSWDEPGRIVAAGLGLAIALAAVVLIVYRALQVLAPLELSLDAVAESAPLRAAVEQHPALLSGAPSVDALRTLLANPDLLDEDELAAWLDVRDAVVDHAAFAEARSRFERAWRWMLGGAAAGALGIVAFSWGANPPRAPPSPQAVLQPAPVSVRVDLTPAGRAALGDAVGRRCAEPIRGVAIGGSVLAPKIVTAPGAGACRAAEFVLSPEWGAARAVAQVPLRR